MGSRVSSTKEVYAALAASFLYSSVACAAEESFSVKLHIMKPLKITAVTDLQFDAVTYGKTQSLTTSVSDSSAVQISAIGEPGAQVIGVVVEDSVVMTMGEGASADEQITVDSFELGGDMNSRGVTQFNADGVVENIRVGATAHVSENNLPGFYASEATFRLLYL